MLLQTVDTRRRSRGFLNAFFATSHEYDYPRTGSSPGVAERPKDSGSSVSVRPRWKQGVPYVGSKRQAPGER